MARSVVAGVFAEEWAPLVATLMRDLGDLDLAEEMAQEAFVEAATRWGLDTTPERPGAWLTTTARRKAIDRLRRDKRFVDRLPGLVAQAELEGETDQHELGDAQLAMVFGCCHPALGVEAQVAMTLRHVGGLSTNQIASAFLVPEATMAKRLVRAKAKVAAANVPFVVPAADALTDRLNAVLAVIYLIFTEGHTSASGGALIRGDLCDEARWLLELLMRLLPEEPEIAGLAALVNFTDSRRASRLDGEGEIVLLEDQDRSRWNRQMIDDGHRQLESALVQGDIGPFQLQAAIAATHAVATSATDTDWRQIVHLYRRLYQLQPSPVIALNAAVAIAMDHGPAAGLEAIDNWIDDEALAGYRYLPSVRGDLLRRLGRFAEAAEQYRAAIDLSDDGPEKRFLQKRLGECSE